MYRSNDVVQFNRKSLFIRPFVKVGEKARSVKVFQFFVEDTNSHEADIRIQQLSRLGVPNKLAECRCASDFNPEDDWCRRSESGKAGVDCQCQAREATSEKEETKSLFSRMASLFQPKKQHNNGPYSELAARKR